MIVIKQIIIIPLIIVGFYPIGSIWIHGAIYGNMDPMNIPHFFDSYMVIFPLKMVIFPLTMVIFHSYMG